MEVEKISKTDDKIINKPNAIIPFYNETNKVYPITTNNNEVNLELTWEDINIILEDKKVTKNILTNVSGSLKSGETLAILGASGAGKTTLLNHLSRKIDTTRFKHTGKMLLNNQEVSNSDFNSITSYVMQDDVLEPEMTPREILLFTARLKINASREVQESKVAEMLKILKIEKCQNTKIGDNLHRGVSGGERKRVSIAVELLSDSPILFLDEPTTGLDSYNAFEVISAIKKLALDKNKIVIFTIHQPASEIFQLMNKICVLALGKTVYFGLKENLEIFFTKIKLPIPYLYNPFEHIIEMTTLTSVECSNVLQHYPNILTIEDKQERYKSYIDTISDLFKSDFKPEKNKYETVSSHIRQLMYLNKNITGFLYQLYNLILRQILITIRTKKILMIRIFQNIFVGVIIALVFSNLEQNAQGIRNRFGAFNMLTVLGVFNAVNASIMVCKWFI